MKPDPVILRAMRYCRVRTVAELHALKTSDPGSAGMSLLEWARNVKPSLIDESEPPFM